jgi:hypothetical protein
VDIHELLSPNLLHQIIKGAFKDIDYIEETNMPNAAKRILADIDQRLAMLV